jgi:hypothetical protein
MKTVILAGKIDDPHISPRALCHAPMSADLWGFSAMQMEYYRQGGELADWTEWYDVHFVDSRPWHPGIKKLRPHAWEWYKTLGPQRPLYLAETHPDVPAAVRFPLEDVERFFAPLKDPDEDGLIWTCQIDYMLAFAIMRDYKHIIIQGHGTATNVAHVAQHRGALFWIGVARTVGIRVTVLRPSVYRSAPRYAYESGGFTVPLVANVPVNQEMGVLELRVLEPVGPWQ